MSKNNLFKLLFAAMFAFAATAFTACTDDNDELTTAPVLEATPSALTFTGEGGTQTVVITANCGWTVDASSLEGWADVSPMSGEGNGELTVTTYEATTSHTGAISFMLQHEYYGDWGKADATVMVKQNSGDVPVTPTGDALYEENCGNSVSKGEDNYWPYVTDFEGWQRGGTLDQSGVTYGGKSSSVRNSGASYDDNTVSGAPYISVKTLEISNINIASNTNFTLQFATQNTVSTLPDSPYTPTFGEISASSFKLEVGVNGTWYPVTFAASPLGGEASWYTCVAPFKLAADMSTSTLAIRVSGFTGGSNLRLDDLKLFEGGEGAELGGGVAPPQPGKEGTISAITGEGPYTVNEAVVAATYKSGFLIEDETGVILVYQYVKDGPEFKVPAVGTKVSVSGTVTTYGGMLQFGSDGLQITENGTASIQKRTPVELDGPAADALKNAEKPSYIKYSGALTVSGNYYNVAIPGATIIGSLQYPNDDLNAASFDGKTVDVVGWHVGCASNGKYLNTMVVSLSGDGEAPDPGPDVPVEGAYTIDLSKQGFLNNTSQDGKSITDGGFTLTFAKGTGGSNPSWFDNGSAFRLYAGNTLTVTGKSLTRIDLVFANEYDFNKITTDVPTYTEPTWTGEAASVTFTVDGVRGEQSSDAGKTGGNRRITKVIVYGEGGGDVPTPPTPPTPGEGYTFTKTSTIVDGQQYLIVADGQKAKYITQNYGYLKVDAVTDVDGKITVASLEDAFTLTAENGGYTIKQSDNRYLIQKGTYNSYNLEAAPTAGHIFSIEPQSDGTFKITNTSVNKYMQYDSQYSSFGSYEDARGTLPTLYVLGEGGGTPTPGPVDPTPDPDPVDPDPVDPTPSGSEAVFDYTTITTVDATVNGVSVTCVANGGNPPAYNASAAELRVYRYNGINFTAPEGKNITKIEFTFSDTSRMGYEFGPTDGGTYTSDSATLTGTWTGSNSTVSFLNNGDQEHNVQARFKKIVVNFE